MYCRHVSVNTLLLKLDSNSSISGGEITYTVHLEISRVYSWKMRKAAMLLRT